MASKFIPRVSGQIRYAEEMIYSGVIIYGTNWGWQRRCSDLKVQLSILQSMKSGKELSEVETRFLLDSAKGKRVVPSRYIFVQLIYNKLGRELEYVSAISQSREELELTTGVEVSAVKS